ncbi:hypothetical protein APZ41_017480 [Roseomonas mucosa]|uniref:Uncharacterized protein n=1 Tax=Roseomonas mucosa TaxID=207340 RepID=A0A1S8D2P5_9PROT|nr:hypothetical protein APZ41_017480 [Roseomonas mucosa]
MDGYAVRSNTRLTGRLPGLVGLVTGAVAYGLLIVLFMAARPPILRLAVALVSAAPAAVAGYALVHGITGEAAPSEVWRTIFCLIGAGVTGLSALMRIASPPQ